MNQSYVYSFFTQTLWALLPAKLAQLSAVAGRHLAGDRLSAEEVAQIAAARREPVQRSGGAVAVIPIYGTIIPHGDQLMESSGAVSATRIHSQLQQALADPEVGAIVLDIDSPGGSVDGIEELGNAIHSARGQKKITSVSDYLMASAAYWIGSQADEVVASPSSGLGSIGVYAAHADMSRAYDQAGVTITLVSEGKYKTEGNPWEPLTAEARAAIQARIAPYYNSFTKAVARGRGVSVEAVRSGFGEGRVVGARQAVDLGLADRVATLDEVISSAARQARRGLSASDRARRLRLAQHGGGSI